MLNQSLFILAQAERPASSGSPLIFLLVFGLGIGAIIFFVVRRGKLRTESQDRAQQLGWTYTGAQDWDKMPGADYKVNYSYSGQTNGIQWLYTYSTKRIKRQGGGIGDSSLSEGGVTLTAGARSTLDSRSDWRTDASSSPHIVFIMPRTTTSPKLIPLKKWGPDRLASLVLNPGLTEADQNMGTRLEASFGGTTLRVLSNPLGNLPETNFGLQEIEALGDETFQVFATDEASAREVLNTSAQNALAAWKTAFNERFPSNAKGYAHRQPFIVFHPSGLYLYFTEEEPNVKALEAIVDLGSRLAASQPARSTAAT